MTIRPLVHAVVCLVSAAFVATGCAGTETDAFIGASDGEGNEDVATEIRVRPDAGENLAHLTVKLPTGACTAGGSCTRPLSRTPNLSVDGVALALGTDRRLVQGNHVISVDGLSFGVQLSPGQQKSVTLPVAHRKCTADTLPVVATTDFGSTPTVTNVDCPSTLSLASANTVADPFAGGAKMTLYYGSPGAGCASAFVVGYTRANFSPSSCSGWNTYNITGFTTSTTTGCRPINVNAATLCNAIIAGDYSQFPAPVSSPATLSDGDLAYVPGAYSYALGTAPEAKAVTLAEGALTEIAIQLPVANQLPAVFSTQLVLDEPRELPDAAASTIISSAAGERTFVLASTATGTQNLKAFVNPNAVYTLKVGGRTVTLDQTRTNKVNLKRLDVDHVVVTREDNTSYVLPGRYEVYFGGNLVAGPFATNTGIDMLPGTYELVIKYTTAEGPQVEHYTLSL